MPGLAFYSTRAEREACALVRSECVGAVEVVEGSEGVGSRGRLSCGALRCCKMRCWEHDDKDNRVRVGGGVYAVSGPRSL